MTDGRSHEHPAALPAVQVLVNPEFPAVWPFEYVPPQLPPLSSISSSPLPHTHTHTFRPTPQLSTAPHKPCECGAVSLSGLVRVRRRLTLAWE